MLLALRGLRQYKGLPYLWEGFNYVYVDWFVTLKTDIDIKPNKFQCFSFGFLFYDVISSPLYQKHE